jgi:DNA-binding transcriptional MerR regulator
MSQPYLTMGQVAARFGVRQDQVRNLYRRGFLPPAARVGAYRVVHEQDLPKVEEALLRAGYLKEAAPCTSR